MPAKIRLARRGRKKRVFYHIVVADSRAPRDGRYIEKLGVYNPLTNPATIEFDQDKALEWLMNGAQPTDTVRAMLSYKGVMFKKHLQIGVNKGAITQEEADKKFADWMKQKEGAVEGKKAKLAKDADDKKKKALEAEKAKSDARAEAIKAKEAEAIAAEEAAKAEAEATEASSEEAEGTEEAPAEEAQAEEKTEE